MVKENSRVLIYTDGSSYQGYISTPMVIPQLQQQMIECISTEDTLIVYIVEACGIRFTLSTLLQFAEDDSQL